MASENWLDDLARALARAQGRRAMLVRLGGLVGVVLAWLLPSVRSGTAAAESSESLDPRRGQASPLGLAPGGLASAKVFAIDGTVDCGVRSGRRCTIGDTLAVWTDDVSGALQRVVVDVSWIRRQLEQRRLDQDDRICLEVEDHPDGGLRALSLLECEDAGTQNPGVGRPEQPKRPNIDNEVVPPEATGTPTGTPTSTATGVPAAPTNTPTPTVTPTATPTRNGSNPSNPSNVSGQRRGANIRGRKPRANVYRGRVRREPRGS